MYVTGLSAASTVIVPSTSSTAIVAATVTSAITIAVTRTVTRIVTGFRDYFFELGVCDAFTFLDWIESEPKITI